MKLCFRLFAILFILPAFFAVKAQENQPEIKILRQASQKGFGCYFDNGVMPESEFEKIRAEKDCGSLRSLEIDFEKESLIAFYAIVFYPRRQKYFKIPKRKKISSK